MYIHLDVSSLNKTSSQATPINNRNHLVTVYITAVETLTKPEKFIDFLLTTSTSVVQIAFLSLFLFHRRESSFDFKGSLEVSSG